MGIDDLGNSIEEYEANKVHPIVVNIAILIIIVFMILFSLIVGNEIDKINLI